MPLARSNTRSKSRSPAPPPDFHSFPSPRPFLPPSHYAAAGGFTNTSGLRSSTRNDKIDSPNTEPLQNAFFPSQSRSPDSQSPYQNLDSFMPIVFPSDSSTSDSSFEFKPAPSAESRFSSISLRRNKSSSSSASSNSRTKRRSQLTNLPLLEAQLLPSLRDTIDRMTRPPSRTSATSYPSSPSHLEPPNHSTKQRSPSPSSQSSESNSYSSSVSTTTLASLTPPSKGQIFSSPKSVSSPRPGISTPSLLEPSTPIAKPPVPTKSVLKSALRTPTAKYSGKTVDTASSLRSPSPGVSLRSVRSTVGKKTPTLGLSERDAPMPKTGSKSVKSPSLGRSRADSEIAPAPKPSDINHAKSKSNLNSKKFVSNLPRRLPNGRFDESPNSRGELRVDDSDLEYRYEAEGRGRRNLIVANADVMLTSSSESESEARNVRLDSLERDSDGQNHRKMQGERRLVGLGFGLENDVSNGTHGDDATADLWDEGVEDDVSVYEDENIQPERAEHEGTDLKFSTPFKNPWYDGRGRENKRLDFSESSSGTREFDSSEEAHRRRKAALMGIVNGLELGLGSAQGTYSTNNWDGQNECESDYFVQEGVGVAVSGSGDVSMGEGGTRGEEQGEESDEESDYGNEDVVGQTQGTPMPMLLVSAEDDRGRGRHPGDASPHRPTSSPRTDNDGKRSRKSPSRSPVIRQPEDEAMPMPATLKRHSVYHGSPFPSASPRTTIEGNTEVIGNDNLDADEGCGRWQTGEEDDLGPSDAVTVARRSYAAVSRERKAFGIPPSESEEVHQSHREHVRENGMLPRVDSDLSSVGSTLWHDECEELSVGAEALFRKLSGGRTKEIDRMSHQIVDDNLRYNEDGDFLLEHDPVRSLQSPMSQSSSASSFYDTPQPEGVSSDISLESRTWRSDIPAAAYAALLERHGDAEMHRQEIIWKLCQTEESFVRRLHAMTKLFILPLRLQHTRTWISGVPLEVSNLFDWLEDIVNLHSKMLSALQTARTDQYPVVERIAESIRAFVPRLEVYQPYLVRLTDTSNVIIQLVGDEKSDFGEFVKIQERAEECDGWDLERFLVEPANRLAKYPDFFQQLLDWTCKSHPDYLPTFALLRSTEMVIRVMTEVKIREEEYDLIKNISAAIRGLPTSMQLARRERRLLTEGLLQRTEIRNRTHEAIHPYSLLNGSDLRNDAHSVSRARAVAGDRLKRSSRLFDAINTWDIRRERAGSVTTASSSTGVSFRSFGTSSTGSPDLLLPPFSGHFPPHCDLISPSLPDSRKAELTSHNQSKTKPLPIASTLKQEEAFQPDLVQVFVFTDLIFLATPFLERKHNETQEWCILEDIGISRILGVKECTEKNSAASPLIALDILPVDVKNMDKGVIQRSASVKTIYLAVPVECSKTRLKEEETRKAWISAFLQCFQFTLRSLSVPSHPDYLIHGPNGDLEVDTQNSILGLLASGLPLPKSPSVQLEDGQCGKGSDPRTQEREERGWWSLRFQQVLRELLRRDVAIMFNA